MKIQFTIIFLFCFFYAGAQSIDTIRLRSELPIRNGYTLRYKDLNYPLGVEIHSYDRSADSVFSVSDGTVVAFGGGENEYHCTIKSANLFWSYSLLRDCPLKPGDQVFKGSFLGLAAENQGSKYFQFSISRPDGLLDFKDHLRVLNRQ